jgi:glycosyltransferase involved in cell wall biosynthesis
MRRFIFNGGTLAKKEIYGVQRMTWELLKGLDKIVPKNSVELVIPQNNNRVFDFKNIKVKQLDLIKDVQNSKLKLKLWNYIVFPIYLKIHQGIGVDLMLGFSFTKCHCVCVADCITERFSENANTLIEKISRKFYMQRVKRNIKNSEVVITISEQSKKDILTFYKVDENKIKVIPCAWNHFTDVDPDFKIIEKLNLQKNGFYFSLGSNYVHKNFKWILSAARKNPREKFVVSGTNKLNTSANDIYYNNLKNVIFTDYISDGEIKALMMNCKAFIQPSLYEGFGLPPMEAMSVGAKVIVSNTSCLPEIYDNSVFYIDPMDYDNIDFEKIFRQRISNTDDLLRKYSWDKSAGLLWDTLLKVFKC